MRTKQEFRAIRERVGMSQALLARTMGVSQRSVRFWEQEDSRRNPPEEAWGILDHALEQQRRGLEMALAQVDAIIDNMDGDEPRAINLPYWLCESDYLENSTDAARGVAGDWRMANANNMALALRLEERGFDVVWTKSNPARPHQS